jgi:molybdopterin converting factor small subunit
MLMMQINVKLYATLRRFGPEGIGIGEAFTVHSQGTTIGELIQQLGISRDEAKIIMVNGNRVIEMNEKLAENDLVVIFPPVGGG